MMVSGKQILDAGWLDNWILPSLVGKEPGEG